MVTINETRLRQMIPAAPPDTIRTFIGPMLHTMERYQISTPTRVACFIAQITHESGSLHYVREIASGRAYEGRADLGNTQPGDGVRFKGRGLIQITGRANYTQLAADLKVNCVENPALLELPAFAVLSAGWFWNLKGLNKFADKGDMRTITRRINGGLNGFDERMQHYRLCKLVMEA